MSLAQSVHMLHYSPSGKMLLRAAVYGVKSKISCIRRKNARTPAEVSFSSETSSGLSWLKHPAPVLAEHVRMMKTTGQNPQPCFSEGWMSEVSEWPTHLPVWQRHITGWMLVMDCHVLWVCNQRQAVFIVCSDVWPTVNLPHDARFPQIPDDVIVSATHEAACWQLRSSARFYIQCVKAQLSHLHLAAQGQ